MQDKITNLHDLIVGPKFNMILDHPVLLKEHIQAGPKDYYLLIHDRNYLAFAKKYFKNIKDCFLFTPGGIIAKCSDAPVEKKYDISFIGSYYNYRPIISNIKRDVLGNADIVSNNSLIKNRNICLISMDNY